MMLIIDGSTGEGGGQIVRTGVALSVILNKPVKFINIRQGRDKPGLKHQHLHAISALAELTGAVTEGLHLGSSELVFEPQGIMKNHVKIQIPTAGSIGLCLQCLIPALMLCDKRVTIEFEGGATCGQGSPPLDYIKNVWLPNMSLWGVTPPEVIVGREGYYPKGGAVVTVKTKPSKLHPYSTLGRGEVLRIKGVSHSSKSLMSKEVALRQAREAKKLLGDANIDVEYSESLCPGSSLTLWAECEKSVIGADSLGAIRVTSEMVARSAVRDLKRELTAGSAFDSHMTDMLIPVMALAGDSEITTSEVTNHTRTNAWLCEQFSEVKFSIKGCRISCK